MMHRRNSLNRLNFEIPLKITLLRFRVRKVLFISLMSKGLGEYQWIQPLKIMLTLKRKILFIKVCVKFCRARCDQVLLR